jgi:hypothetical protein
MWMCLKRHGGTGMCCIGTFTWRWILACWQCRQALSQAVTSLENPFHMYLEAMRRRVALICWLAAT